LRHDIDFYRGDNIATVVATLSTKESLAKLQKDVTTTQTLQQMLKEEGLLTGKNESVKMYANISLRHAVLDYSQSNKSEIEQTSIQSRLKAYVIDSTSENKRALRHALNANAITDCFRGIPNSTTVSEIKKIMLNPELEYDKKIDQLKVFKPHQDDVAAAALQQYFLKPDDSNQKNLQQFIKRHFLSSAPMRAPQETIKSLEALSRETRSFIKPAIIKTMLSILADHKIQPEQIRDKIIAALENHLEKKNVKSNPALQEFCRILYVTLKQGDMPTNDAIIAAKEACKAEAEKKQVILAVIQSSQLSNLVSLVPHLNNSTITQFQEMSWKAANAADGSFGKYIYQYLKDPSSENKNLALLIAKLNTFPATEDVKALKKIMLDIGTVPERKKAIENYTLLNSDDQLAKALKQYYCKPTEDNKSVFNNALNSRQVISAIHEALPGLK
jgi:hypothetical protein